MREKALDPVTFVRSPILTNPTTGLTLYDSRPDKRIGAITRLLILLPLLEARGKKPVAYVLRLHWQLHECDPA